MGLIRFKTVDDFRAMYGPEFGDIAYEMYKADDPLLQGTTGNYLAHATALVWANLNFESNPFSLIRKVNGATSNDKFRVVTGRPSTGSNGIAEGGGIPENVKHDFAFVHVTPKWVATSFKASQYAIASAERGQALKWEDMVALWAKDYVYFLSNDLMTHNGLSSYSSNKPARLDTIIGSYGEISNCNDVDGNAYTTGELDLYNSTIDRDTSASWQDAVVLHNSSTERDFHPSLLRDLETAVARNSGKYQHPDQTWLTGYDGVQRIGEEIESKQRFMDVSFETFQSNGVKTFAGRKAGFKVTSFDNMPIISTQTCPGGTLSHWYLIDRQFMFMNMMEPTRYFQAGIREGKHLYTREYAEEGLYQTAYEVVSTFMGAHGKVRDLK